MSENRENMSTTHMRVFADSIEESVRVSDMIQLLNAAREEPRT